MKWQRPAGEYPRIWLNENGFVIRDVTPDIQEYVIDHMVENFCRDEPLNKSQNLIDDLEAVEELKQLWYQEFLPQKICIVALAENEPGADLKPVGPENPPRILGANMLNVAHKNDPKTPPIDEIFKTKTARTILGTVMYIAGLENVYERYGVDHYIDAAGLSVCPSTRGKGLGLMLLRARIEVGKAFKIPLTKTVFTAIASQKLAEKTGFEVIGEKDYDTFIDQDGKTKIFPNMAPTKFIQLRARRIL